MVLRHFSTELINRSMETIKLKGTDGFDRYLDSFHPQTNGGKRRNQISVVIKRDHPQFQDLIDLIERCSIKKYGVFDTRRYKIPHVNAPYWKGNYRNKYPELYDDDFIMFNSRGKINEQVPVMMSDGSIASVSQIKAFQQYPHKIDIDLEVIPFGSYGAASPGLSLRLLSATLCDCGKPTINTDVDTNPPVTRILKRTATESERLAYRVGTLGYDKDIGSKVHEMMELTFTDGIRLSGKEWGRALPYYNTLLTGLSKGLDDVIGVEVSCPVERKWTGTIDMVGIHSGKLSLIDYKTSGVMRNRHELTSYFLQVAAYSLAWEYNNPGHKIEQCIIAMVTQDEYKEFILGGEELDKYRCRFEKKVEQFWGWDNAYRGEMF